MKFEEKEVENAKVSGEGTFYFNVAFDSPITPRENVRHMYQKNPCWIPVAGDAGWFCPSVIPDNIARAFVIEAQPWQGAKDGPDMFGIKWEYEPKSRGSIVRPGNAYLKDVTQWKEFIHFPDFDSYDWTSSIAMNKEFLHNSDHYINFCVFTGWFERLISFLDCGPALIALQNRKLQPYTAELLDRISDTWIDLIDHVKAAYGSDIDGFVFHDDWGAQDGPFFNPKIVEKMLVPPMKRVTDYLHQLGYTCELHSCGKIDKLLPCVIAAGWDSWDGMGINDYHADYPAYSDKLIMHVTAEEPAGATPAESAEAAQKYADEYGDPGRPCMISIYSPTSAEFRKDLYRISRIRFDR